MFQYTTGDLLESPADALVNAVNCEGIMGKGIAYQFKRQYPGNFQDYRRACQTGALRPGRLHHFSEGGKWIINFPTKDRWRDASRMEYVESGLAELAPLIRTLSLKSIAIPPLGCGNGGLPWSQVRQRVEDALSEVAQETDIYLYGPSSGAGGAHPLQEPRLGPQALVLMELKLGLKAFSAVRLQNTAYFLNVFSHSQYFKFHLDKSGPYSRAIATTCQGIKSYQAFLGKSTEEARTILYRKLVSASVDRRLNSLRPYIKAACDFANDFPEDRDLECLAAVCCLVEQGQAGSEQAVVDALLDRPGTPGTGLRAEEITKALEVLYDREIIERNLEGFYLV